MYQIPSKQELLDYGLSEVGSNKILKQLNDILRNPKLCDNYLKPSSHDINGPWYYLMCHDFPLYYFGFFVQVDTILRIVDERYNLRGDDIDVIKTLERFGRSIIPHFMDIMFIGLHLDYKKLISIIIRDPKMSIIFPATTGFDLFTIEYIEQRYCIDKKFDINNEKSLRKLTNDLHFGYYSFNGNHYLARILREFIPVTPIKNYMTVDDLDENDVLVISI